MANGIIGDKDGPEDTLEPPLLVILDAQGPKDTPYDNIKVVIASPV